METATAAPVAANKVEGLFDGVNYIEVITFHVGSTQYATPVSEVRYIEQDKRKTTRIVVDQKLGAEVTTYQGKPVPIYDLANIMGCEAEYKKNLDFLAILEARQQDHENWMLNLESSVKNNTEFKGARDATQCELGRWLAGFKADDEILDEILNSFAEPHSKLHDLAGEVLSLRDDGQLKEALAAFQYEKGRTFAKLMALFESAKERIENITRPILLYIDTSKKMIAVRLNAISDIVSYQKNTFTPQEDVDDNQKLNDLTFVAGYLENVDDEPPCVLLDWRLFTSPNAASPNTVSHTCVTGE
jgi:chemotaxis signal transduction protein